MAKYRMSVELFDEMIADVMRQHGFEEYPYCGEYTARNGKFEARISVPSYKQGLPELLEPISVRAAWPDSAVLGLASRLIDLRRRMREFDQVEAQTQEIANGEG